MLPLGSGPTRATLAWLSGALMACALIAACLLVLRSDVLPFQGSWPSLHGSRPAVTELAPAPARVTGAGTGGATPFSPVSTGGAIVALPGVGGQPVAARGPVATVPAGGNANGSTGSEQTSDANRVGAKSQVPTTTGTTPAITGSPISTTPAITPAATGDTAPVVADTPDATSPAARPQGRTTDADSGRADDHPPADSDAGADDTPAAPVDDGQPAASAPVDPAASAPASDPTPAPATPADPSPPAEATPEPSSPPVQANP
jgi:hypothetical protein